MANGNFADKLRVRVLSTNSSLCAGIDPRIETIPHPFTKQTRGSSKDEDQFIFEIITNYYSFALEAIYSRLSCVKPNIAFFEQYGISGLKAFTAICKKAGQLGLPVIADIKRSDIGSTAKAYTNAFLTGTPYKLKECFHEYIDAITVNPFLGKDTLEVFIKGCKGSGKGMFVLVKTSNPGSADLQQVVSKENDKDISEILAEWLNLKNTELKGQCGLSALGAVVGATYPEEAKQLRKIMPNNIFLIPGFGAQGGTAETATAGFSGEKGSAIINVSRGLFSSFSSLDLTKEQVAEELTEKTRKLNSEINNALQK